MTRGLYAAAGAMLAGMLKHEVLANNLANVSTPGYKADRVSLSSFQRILLNGIPGDGGGSAVMYQSGAVEAPVIDQSAGSLTNTGNPLDLAIQGDGWFTVATAEGERYTRNGNFEVYGGFLTTSDGLPVLAEDGPLAVPDGATVEVRTNGEVFADGAPLGRLKLVRFAAPEQAVKVGHGLVAGGAAEPSLACEVRQGMLEESNADTTRQMVEMMALMRSYETNQRVIQAQDQTLEQAISVAR